MTFLSEQPLTALWILPLVTVRVASILRLTPFLGGGPMPLAAWLSASSAIALGIFATLTTTPGPPPSLLFWSALFVKELLIGCVIGAFVRLSFSILEVVGSLADLSTSPLPSHTGDDPQTRSPLAQFVWLFGAVAFLGAGGHHFLLDGVVSTFRCFPANQLAYGHVWEHGSSAVIALFATMMGTAVLLAVPLYLAGLVADFLRTVIVSFLPRSETIATATIVRTVFVQLVFIAAFGVIARGAIEFIGESLRALGDCNSSFFQ